MGFALNVILNTICLGLLVFFPAAAHGGMIEPTRSLGDAAGPQAKLTVLSEPAGLDVILNGQSMGKTPLFLIDLPPGAHRLKVNNQQTTIRLEAGKTLQISLYRGKFIKIPAAAKQSPEAIKPPAQKSAPPSPSALPAEQGPEDGLTPMERLRLLKHY